MTKFQVGYAYRTPLGPVNLTLGGTVAPLAKPNALDAAYGKNPMGYTVFAKPKECCCEKMKQEGKDCCADKDKAAKPDSDPHAGHSMEKPKS